MLKQIKFACFGTSSLSTLVLNKLKENGFIPSLIITSEDKPKGRKMLMTPPEAKVWALNENVPFLQPKSLRSPDIVSDIRKYFKDGCDLFVVASYGKILPKNVLDIPEHGVLNVHPSLLPKLRGPSPIKSAILTENQTGVSIIKLDEEMDHGPILEEKIVPIENWPPYENELEEILGSVGGEMLSNLIPKWIAGEIEAKEQDHNLATYCQKIKKGDGEINLSESPEINLRKIRAFHRSPTSYFFDQGKRIVVKKARIEEGKLILERIVPEGKKEMDYESYLRGKKN